MLSYVRFALVSGCAGGHIDRSLDLGFNFICNRKYCSIFFIALRLFEDYISNYTNDTKTISHRTIFNERIVCLFRRYC